MIKGIGLSNFRVFGKEEWLDLKPITILTGQNSSGKSTILKALLLLKDCFKKDFETLDFTGEEHHLSNFTRTMNKNHSANNNQIKFTFPFDFPDLLNYNIELTYGTNKKNKLGNGILEKIEINSNTDNTWFANFYKKEKYWHFEFNYEKIREIFNVNCNVCKKNIEEVSIDFDYYPIDIGESNYFDKSNKEYNLIKFQDFNNQLPLIFNIPCDESLFKKYSIKNLNDLNKILIKDEEKNLNKLYNSNKDAVDIYDCSLKGPSFKEQNESFYWASCGNSFNVSIKSLNKISNSIISDYFLKKGYLNFELNKFNNFKILIDFYENFFKFLNVFIQEYIGRFDFLPAVRSSIKQSYSFNETLTPFGKILLEYEKQGFNIEDKEVEFIKNWLETFSISKDFLIDVDNEGSGVKVKFDKELLSEKGYGTIQLLPILLKIAVLARENKTKGEDGYGRNESTLYIEEPETNLHPNFQSKLADMFIEANKKFKIQFILETHSEYLIRRMQFLVAKEKIKPEEICLRYFNSEPNSKERQYRIDFRKDGILKQNFGSGFFDEATNLTMDLLTNIKSN